MITNIRRVIEIRYAQIRSLDLSNGEGVGVALFVQGCHFHCENCFNPETWDFDGGKEWTEEVKNKFLELANKSYIKRISILGGEPLAKENLDDVLDLVNEFRLSSPRKSIWLYTGFIWESIMKYETSDTDDFNYIEKSYWDGINERRKEIISQCTVLIDGQYIDSQHDITLPYRGSVNQRLINIKQSLQKSEIVLWQT